MFGKNINSLTRLLKKNGLKIFEHQTKRKKYFIFCAE
jgi:hypothetical protein